MSPVEVLVVVDSICDLLVNALPQFLRYLLQHFGSGQGLTRAQVGIDALQFAQPEVLVRNQQRVAFGLSLIHI